MMTLYCEPQGSKKHNLVSLLPAVGSSWKPSLGSTGLLARFPSKKGILRGFWMLFALAEESIARSVQKRSEFGELGMPAFLSPTSVSASVPPVLGLLGSVISGNLPYSV